MPDHDLPRSPDDADRVLDAVLADSYQHVEEALRAGLNLEEGLAQITGQEWPSAEAPPPPDVSVDTPHEYLPRFQRSQAGPAATVHGSPSAGQYRQPRRAASVGRMAAVGVVAAEAAWEAEQPVPVRRPGGPMVQRIVLGGHLRRLREIACITMEQAADVIRASHTKISRIEHGRVGIKEADIADLLTLYGVIGLEREDLLQLAQEANTPSSWKVYSHVLPYWLEPYFGLEAAAAFIRNYELQFVPGLLQTESYARALIRQGNAATEDEVTRRTEARLSRQAILSREDPPRLWAVMDEGALRRTVGGEDVMREQIRHLIDMCDHRAVTLQILPFQAGAHPAMGGPFTILRFADPDLRDVVYIEQLTSALYLDRPTQVDGYLEVMEQLSLRAEPVAKTPELLRSMLAET